VKSCTVDTCNPGGPGADPLTGCVFTPSNALCDDHNVCDGTETCDPSNGSSDPATGCVPGMNAPAGTACQSDGVACTLDACDAMGDCLHTPNDAVCDDLRTCTADHCDVALGCVHLPDDTVC